MLMERHGNTLFPTTPSDEYYSEYELIQFTGERDADNNLVTRTITDPSEVEALLQRENNQALWDVYRTYPYQK